MVLEDKGIRVFDHSVSVLRAKAVACMARVESESPELMLHSKNLNQNIFGCNRIDVNEDQEMGDQSNKEFPGALCLMSTKTDAGKKRKEALSGVQESRVKQAKFDLFGSSIGEKFLPFPSDNGPHCGSLVKNVASDDDMELIG